MESAQATDSRRELVEQWKTVVGAQMHFNDMILRTRTLGVSVVIGVFGAAAALASRSPQPTVQVSGNLYHASALVILLGLALLISVFLLDYLYYYKLLIAAVDRGEQLENELSRGATKEPTHTFNLAGFLSARVSRQWAKHVIWGFYGVPFLAGVVFLMVIQAA